MRMSRQPRSTFAWQALICIAVLSIWQWGYDLHPSVPWLVPDLLDPYFVSKPSEIFEHFLLPIYRNIAVLFSNLLRKLHQIRSFPKN